ncbi:MAG TPA: DUF3352 domain-containing protein [Solirubrobacterales bacterium]|jgi:hypothetical protein|nr:DUF3352 domain-containing protein [Solirubrobacterales bacterium]
MRVRLVSLLALAAAALALVVAGCGGGDDSSGSDPAAVAPAASPVYIQVALKPEGTLQSNIESLAAKVAGVDNLGALIVEELESSAVSSDEDLDFSKEIEPWLGEKAGISLQQYDGDDFQGFAVAIQSTDTDATQDFIDKQSADEVAKKGSYEGSEFLIEEDDDTAVGIVGDFLVVAEDEDSFKAVVDASDGDSLADEDAYTSAIGNAPDDSLADVFVDIGGLIEESGGTIDPEAQQFLETAGIDAKEATAIASLVPGADQVEINFSTNAAGDNPPTGDASKMLGSLPGGSFAALATADFGERFNEAIDRLDETGIPGEIEPNELKKALKEEANIDLEKIGSSIGDIGVFAQGNTENNLTGALVLESTSAKEATNTVSNIGLLLRATGTPGVTAISGDATGFSIRDADLGGQPIVVAAKGDKIAVSYGLAASTQALTAGQGSTLAENPAFKAAGSALGDTPISGFVAGPAALALIENMLPAEEQAELEELRPYLDKIEYVAIGAGASGDLATSKLIIGFTP